MEQLPKLPAERRLSSAILGGAFLGLLMAALGFLPQQGSDQPLPIWVYRAAGWGGVVLALCTLPARSGKNWARLLSMTGLALTIVPLGLLLVYSLLGGRFNPFTLLLGFGMLACGKGIAFYNSPEIRALFGGPPAPPAALPVSPPVCPKCHAVLSGMPTYCSSCGFPVRGTPMRFRWVWTLFIIAAVAVTVSQSRKQPGLPASGSEIVDDDEITVGPHSVYWTEVEPMARGEAVFRVTVRETPVGMNLALIGNDGVTKEIDEHVRGTQIAVDPGKPSEKAFPVEARRKYAVFVINETDERAKAHIKVTLRWGPAK